MFMKFLRFCQRYPIINDFMVVSFIIAVFLMVPAGKADYMLYAEVVEATENTVLASSNHHGLFTFAAGDIAFTDENGRPISSADLPCGAIISMANGTEWLETYPYQCQGITDVAIVERRPDFLEAYLDRIVTEYKDADRETVEAHIETLPDLNPEEKEGLSYKVWMALELF